MYQYQKSSWIDAADIQVPSRPDALLASGGAFLPLAHQQVQEETAMFRRAMSTGDLMLMREEEEQQPRVMAPPARYTAEERRERIDKYRSKRNHRNFQKKITVRHLTLALSYAPLNLDASLNYSIYIYAYTYDTYTYTHTYNICFSWRP